MAYPKKNQKADNHIWRLEDNRYLVELRLDGGYGKLHRKIHETLRAAKIYRDGLFAKKAANADFNPHKKRDKRTLSSLIDTWETLFARELKDGQKRTSKLRFLCQEWGNPEYHNISARSFMEFRQRRLDHGLSLNTVNHDLAYLKAMFNKLVKLKELTDNPLKEVELFTLEQSEIRYLELSEINRFLNELQHSTSRDAYVVSRICLETGCRINEAQTLRNSQVKGGVVQFARTKNSESRAVPISKELDQLIKQGRPRRGKLFGASITKAFKTACNNAHIDLPKGQATHIMRHSFSVHFMRAKGSILDLQKILGHKTLAMTLRYAQFHPDYLADAKVKNPIAQMQHKKNC